MNQVKDRKMAKPRVFIGSSVEGRNVAYAVQQNLLHDAEATVWDQGIFELSATTIESLVKALQLNDFGVFIFSPDDVLHMRGKESSTVRDNVLFEFGLFIGKLGRERVFFLQPKEGDVHLPSDLLGITAARYETSRSDDNMQAATGAACQQLRTQFRKLGGLPGRAEAQTSSKSDTAAVVVKRAWFVDFFEDKYDEAMATLKDEIALQSDEAALVNKAWLVLCEIRSKGDGNIKPLLDFAAANVHSPDAAVHAATLLRLERNAARAMEVLANAQLKFPNSASISQAIAQCHKDVEDHASAIAELQRFGSDNFPEIAIDLAESLERNGKMEEAVLVIRRCYAIHPTHKRLRFKYGRLAQETGQHEIALSLLHSLTAIDPNSTEYWGYLGNTCLQLELFDKALSAYRRAEKIAGNAQWIIANIGNLLSSRGLPTEAADYLRRSVELDPSSEYAYDRMAMALKKAAAEAKLFDKIDSEGKRKIRAAELALQTVPSLSELPPLSNALLMGVMASPSNLI